LRVAMAESDWALFESLVARYAPNSPTLARAHGKLLAGLLHAAAQPEPELGPLDWMDWERRKTLRLLLPSSS
ncbi:MAG TPA: hypothetical protein VKA15_21615, partial [Isosphaeraceae bacterium]|nr:hypothetical protein [Isosphaeraceae bacterium]